ncbi:MAG: hypothetical protein KA368_05495 [Acidobacteria bacterium]|nr:hypothetical protein [Acidobacteriota bacterium]
MASRVYFSQTYQFRIAGERITLYKKNGESYEHVLMKALAYGLFRKQFPKLEIERRIGLRYKPDLIALDDFGKPEFWGECGQVGLRKIGWIAKHSGVQQLAIFKFDIIPDHFISQVRKEVDTRYRQAKRIKLFNFDHIVLKEAGEEFDEVPESWYQSFEI